MSRTQRAAETRAAILTEFGTLVSRQGVTGTGIAEVVHNAGLTKGALFHHFPDKRGMVVAWVEEMLAPGVEYEWISANKDIVSIERLKRYFSERLGNLTGKDAFSALVALAAEVSPADAGLRETCSQVFHKWRGVFTDVVKRGRDEGWIYSSAHPAGEAALLFSLCSGIALMVRAEETEAAKKAVEALQGYLDTLRKS